MEAVKASSATAASSSVQTAAVEGIIMKSDKPTAAGTTTRRTKLVKVEQGIIDGLLARPKREIFAPASPPEGNIFDALAEALEDHPELLEEVEVARADYEAAEAIFKKTRDMDEDILKQYKEKGYAMVELDDEGRAVYIN